MALDLFGVMRKLKKDSTKSIQTHHLFGGIATLCEITHYSSLWISNSSFSPTRTLEMLLVSTYFAVLSGFYSLQL